MIEVALSFHGSGLNRAECVLSHRSGMLFCSDTTGGGGVGIIGSDGTTDRILATDRASPLHPNGIALEPGGTFLIAHLGARDGADGGVFRLYPDGRTEAVLTEIAGRPLPPTNFVQRDAKGRIWVCVSTRLHPRHLAYRPDADDGFVVLIDETGARIVADGLGYTNECVVDVEAGLFFVNETFGRRISRYRIAADGSLHDREIVATFGAGVFPDGLARDVEGGLWVTSVVSNRLIHVAPDGVQTVVIEDSDAAHVAWVEAAFLAGEMGRPHIDRAPPTRLGNLSSLAFGGSDLRTGYLGSLAGSALPCLRMPVGPIRAP